MVSDQEFKQKVCDKCNEAIQIMKDLDIELCHAFSEGVFSLNGDYISVDMCAFLTLYHHYDADLPDKISACDVVEVDSFVWDVAMALYVEGGYMAEKSAKSYMQEKGVSKEDADRFDAFL